MKDIGDELFYIDISGPDIYYFTILAYILVIKEHFQVHLFQNSKVLRLCFPFSPVGGTIKAGFYWPAAKS